MKSIVYQYQSNCEIPFANELEDAWFFDLLSVDAKLFLLKNSVIVTEYLYPDVGFYLQSNEFSVDLYCEFGGGCDYETILRRVSFDCLNKELAARQAINDYQKNYTCLF